MNPTYKIAGQDFIRGREIIVYAWVRDSEYLYIGLSCIGLYRIYNHNIIHKVESVLDRDEIRIWIVKDETTAEQLEKQLIMLNNPKYNRLK